MKIKTIIKSASMGLVLLGIIGVGNTAFAVEYSSEKTKAFKIDQGTCTRTGKTVAGKVVKAQHGICFFKQDEKKNCVIDIPGRDSMTLNRKGGELTEGKYGSGPHNHYKTETFIGDLAVKIECTSAGTVWASFQGRVIVYPGSRPVAVMNSGENFWRKCSTVNGHYSCD